MKKVLKSIKEETLVNIIINLMTMLLGLCIIVYYFDRSVDVNFLTASFYILSLISLISYILYNKDKDYERLFISLSNALIAAYLYFYGNVEEIFVLGTTLIIYTFLLVLVKSINIIILRKIKDNILFLKLITTFLIAVLGLTSSCIISKVFIYQLLIYGFFFFTLGIINLFEPITSIFINNKK